jgi:hypothetical protein
MGAFFTNVHVLAPAERAEAAHAAILDCIRSLASERGLVPCEDDAKADRGFIVRRGATWLSVYDQATESQDIELLDELAARLSASSRCPALAVLVHDSDQLLLRLFQDGQVADEEAPRGVDGFAFGGSLIRSMVEATGGESHELPTLRLVVSLEGRTDVPLLLDRARGIVDDFVRRARCAQAVLMRCRPSSVAWTLDHSAYETACGIHGQHTLHREWCTRFLRGVSADGIWLGPELLARIDRDALAALCRLEPIGETVRAVLRDGATLDALEGALAPVLPSESDWTEAAEARGAEAREAFRALGFTLGGPSKSRAD